MLYYYYIFLKSYSDIELQKKRNTLIRVTRLYNNPILDSKGIYIYLIKTPRLSKKVPQRVRTSPHLALIY